MENVDPLEIVKKKFGISSLRDYQADFFNAFKQEDVPDFFIAQPTGHGKSLLFQGISCFLSSCCSTTTTPTSTTTKTALVICPLNALIDDQVALMAKKDIVAKRLTDDMVCVSFSL